MPPPRRYIQIHLHTLFQQTVASLFPTLLLFENNIISAGQLWTRVHVTYV